MRPYKKRDVFYQNIREQDQVEVQDLILVKIDKSKNSYEFRGVKDNRIYFFQKEYIDVFLRLRTGYPS